VASTLDLLDKEQKLAVFLGCAMDHQNEQMCCSRIKWQMDFKCAPLCNGQSPEKGAKLPKQLRDQCLGQGLATAWAYCGQKNEPGPF
jgi:hypothetical protein